jgi:hypothetical protein
LDLLGEARVFSKIDGHSAFNLIRVSPDSQYLTAFRCKYGHFEYKVMPFGLKNALRDLSDLHKLYIEGPHGPHLNRITR